MVEILALNKFIQSILRILGFVSAEFFLKVTTAVKKFSAHKALSIQRFLAKHKIGQLQNASLHNLELWLPLTFYF